MAINRSNFLKSIKQGVSGKLQKGIKSSKFGLGAVVFAGYKGAKAIKKAEKATIEEIKKQHSPESMKRHEDLMKAIKKQRGKRKMMKKIKFEKRKLKPLPLGGPKVPGWEPEKNR